MFVQPAKRGKFAKRARTKAIYIFMHMNKSNFKKEQYSSPECVVLDIDAENVVCQSDLVFSALGATGLEDAIVDDWTGALL